MSDPLIWLRQELQGLCDQKLIRERRRVTPLADGWCEVDGRRLRNFASNDYLCLAHDPRLIEAASSALHTAGAGARASALVTGRTDWHDRLENRLAEFEGQQAAVLFPTGYAANLGTIAALAGKSDIIFSDALNHASLIDGCRLSGAARCIYRHIDVDMLQDELERASGYRRRLIITDGLFSMDGNLAPLVALCDLAERFDAILIVDEAHGTGILGSEGRGACELLDVDDRVAVRVGTLSKSVGCAGGFVAGSRELADWLWNRARTQVFSTAMPPAMCAAACAAIDIIVAEPWRREKLLMLGRMLREGLCEMEIAAVPDGIGPIVPVILNDPQTALSMAAQLQAAGYLVAAIRPPTVPAGTSRLRMTVGAAHTEDDVAGLLAAIQQAACTIAVNSR